MSLQAAYKQFLAAPSSGALATTASLHYITTTTSYTGATDIIKHLSSLRNVVRKKKEDFLSVVEGQSGGVAAELDTTLEFVTGGGPYLPALDDNFLADRTVHLPIVSRSDLCAVNACAVPALTGVSTHPTPGPLRDI
jgi:hypothetical protein